MVASASPALGELMEGCGSAGLVGVRGAVAAMLCSPLKRFPECFLRPFHRTQNVARYETKVSCVSVPPPTADETDTESEQEDREDTESDHSIRPVTEREQEDRDEIESDQFIQASPRCVSAF